MGYVVTRIVRWLEWPRDVLDVLTRCLQSDDDRVAMMAAQAILDRGYGQPMQSIDAKSGRTRFAITPRCQSRTRPPRSGSRAMRRTCSVGQNRRAKPNQLGYTDSSAVLACLLGPISPHPRHQSWEVPVPRQPLFLVPDPETRKQVPTSLRRSRAALTFDKAAQEFTHLGGTERT